MKIIGYPTLASPDRDSLRRHSKQLLALATEAVALAIEKDEKTALSWLQKQTNILVMKYKLLATLKGNNPRISLFSPQTLSH